MNIKLCTLKDFIIDFSNNYLMIRFLIAKEYGEIFGSKKNKLNKMPQT